MNTRKCSIILKKRKLIHYNTKVGINDFMHEFQDLYVEFWVDDLVDSYHLFSKYFDVWVPIGVLWDQPQLSLNWKIISTESSPEHCTQLLGQTIQAQFICPNTVIL